MTDASQADAYAINKYPSASQDSGYPRRNDLLARAQPSAEEPTDKGVNARRHEYGGEIIEAIEQITHHGIDNCPAYTLACHLAT